MNQAQSDCDSSHLLVHALSSVVQGNSSDGIKDLTATSVAKSLTLRSLFIFSFAFMSSPFGFLMLLTYG